MERPDKLLTADDVAEILQVSRRTAYTIMHQMVHLEKPFRVSNAALRGWLNEKARGPAPEKGQAKAKQKRERMPLMGYEYHIPRRREIAK